MLDGYKEVVFGVVRGDEEVGMAGMRKENMGASGRSKL